MTHRQREARGNISFWNGELTVLVDKLKAHVDRTNLEIIGVELFGRDCTYATVERLRALRDMAAAENSLAGAGMQLGAGLELAAQLMPRQAGQGTAGDGLADRLRLLQSLLEQKLITQEDFESRKRALLERI